MIVMLAMVGVVAIGGLIGVCRAYTNGEFSRPQGSSKWQGFGYVDF
jgi:hypothetical protein